MPRSLGTRLAVDGSRAAVERWTVRKLKGAILVYSTIIRFMSVTTRLCFARVRYIMTSTDGGEGCHSTPKGRHTTALFRPQVYSRSLNNHIFNQFDNRYTIFLV